MVVVSGILNLNQSGRFHVSWKVTGRVSSEEASPHSDSSNDGVVPPRNEENQEDDESVLATSTIARLTTKVSQLEEELRERNAEVYKLREENEKLKKGRFGSSFDNKSVLGQTSLSVNSEQVGSVGSSETLLSV
eukprot:gene9902-18498_t